VPPVNTREPVIPFVDLRAAREELGEELDAAVSRVLNSGRYLLGPELEAFEAEFAEYCGTRHCVGVASGLSALELALQAAGIGPGDEVIVPAYTYIATWIAVTRCGARPVPVDVEESTYNIDASLIPDALTSSTAAIVPVHLRGEPADMDAMSEIAAANDLAVIEDAAQAHGARHRGRRVGGLGAAGAFSFYPAKNIGALGDGGAVTTDDDEIAEKVRMLRNYGQGAKYENEVIGVNSRLSELQSAALRVELPRLDGWNATRRTLAAAYREALEGSVALRLPETPDWAEPVWHLFVVGHPDRDACRKALEEQGIETLIHYPVPPHLSGAYRDLGMEKGSFPVTELLADATLSLPMYPQLRPQACVEVAATVTGTFGASV
jgi:dTDP-3-amino-3,4,6-trideoxy-alpha-D-glucose transaminase